MAQTTFDPQLVLKTSPPRTDSWLLPRERLALDSLGLSDKQAILVHAPAGFGKTSLLMQWRRMLLSKGAVVVWMTVDERDSALGLAQGIGNGLSVASGGRAAGPAFLNWLSTCEDGIAALTGVLVEITEQSFNVVIILDNLDRAQKDVLHEPLAYLIRNAPANLQIIVGVRTGMAFNLSEVIDQNIVARISATELVFKYEETLLIIARHFNGKLDVETSGRLHELTEGWPLGLQLVIATLKKSPQLNAATQAISAFTGDIQRYFVENLIARLSPALSDLLTRISVFDLIHPDLCVAVFPNINADESLHILQKETPVFLQAEDSCWMRMHGLARDFLLARFQLLPQEEREQISMRASEWLSDHALFEEAARHALLAGREETAYELAERTLYQVGYRGRVLEVLKWVDRLPPSELKKRPALWTAAAWSLVLTNRRKEAESIVGYILSDPACNEGQRFEAALISAVAASYDDQLERFSKLMEPWVEQAPHAASQIASRVFTNAVGFGHFNRRELGKARHLWSQVAQGAGISSSDSTRGFAEFGIGFSYFCEGQFHLAERCLRASLVHYEHDMGRRSPISCMMAAVLAATLWEMGGAYEPHAILSYRIDVLERAGLPDAIMLAYLTLARLAAHEGQEGHAFEQLNALIALGEARNMPRLQIAGMCELIRMHAHSQRVDTVVNLCKRLEAFCGNLDIPHLHISSPWISLHLHRALAYGAVVTRDWSRVLEHTEHAERYADAMHLGRDSIEIRLLRGLALARSMKVDTAGLFEESLSLAKAGGMVRTLLATHPEALDLLNKVSKESDFRVGDLQHAIAAVVKPVRAKPGVLSAQDGAYANTLLTSKEHEILELMAKIMSNKQIAIALDIGEQTVKWHAKNIFGKLSASNRNHAVKRAHILGILEMNNA